MEYINTIATVFIAIFAWYALSTWKEEVGVNRTFEMIKDILNDLNDTFESIDEFRSTSSDICIYSLPSKKFFRLKLMKIHDKITEHTSKIYANLRKLKASIDMAIGLNLIDRNIEQPVKDLWDLANELSGNALEMHANIKVIGINSPDDFDKVFLSEQEKRIDVIQNKGNDEFSNKIRRVSMNIRTILFKQNPIQQPNKKNKRFLRIFCVNMNNAVFAWIFFFAFITLFCNYINSKIERIEQRLERQSFEYRIENVKLEALLDQALKTLHHERLMHFGEISGDEEGGTVDEPGR